MPLGINALGINTPGITAPETKPETLKQIGFNDML